MPELAADVREAVAKIAQRLKDGPKTLNELRDWWGKETSLAPSLLREAIAWMLANKLAEGRNIGSTKLLSLAGGPPRDRGSPVVSATPCRHGVEGACTACEFERSRDQLREKVKPAAPPPSPPPSPKAAPPTSEPSPAQPPAANESPGDWIRTADIGRMLGISRDAVAEAIRRRVARGVEMPHRVVRGKGMPREYRRADIEKWVAERDLARGRATLDERAEVGEPVYQRDDLAAHQAQVAAAALPTIVVTKADPADLPSTPTVVVPRYFEEPVGVKADDPPRPWRGSEPPPADIKAAASDLGVELPTPPPVDKAARAETAAAIFGARWRVAEEPDRVDAQTRIVREMLARPSAWLHLELGEQPRVVLERLVATGLYGATIEVVAEQLLLAELRRQLVALEDLRRAVTG